MLLYIFLCHIQRHSCDHEKKVELFHVSAQKKASKSIMKKERDIVAELFSSHAFASSSPYYPCYAFPPFHAAHRHVNVFDIVGKDNRIKEDQQVFRALLTHRQQYYWGRFTFSNTRERERLKG